MITRKREAIRREAPEASKVPEANKPPEANRAPKETDVPRSCEQTLGPSPPPPSSTHLDPPARNPLPRCFYDRPADQVARDLLGRYLCYRTPTASLTLRLVETEAYLGRIDRASHAWNGRRTARTESLYLPPGHFYVYLIYGLHHCLNVVTSGEAGGAVLLRAGEAIEGLETITHRRNLDRPARHGDLAGGPGKLCQALGIDRTLDGTPIGHPNRGVTLELLYGDPIPDLQVATGPRIGIGYAEDAIAWPLRFGIRGHREMSRPKL